MIIAEAEDHFRFVTQPAHADLAGQFADHWGNDRFERPGPDAAMMIAAYTHDTGWREYDLRPRLGDDGRPIDFRDMPPETWIDLYDGGIETVVELDAYAGLVVSLHGSGLRRRRYGLSPSWPTTPPEYSAFVDRQEAFQERLADELRDADRLSESDVELLSTLHESGTPPEGCESRLWRNYKLLQAWDSLSLAFCTTESPPSDSEIHAVPRDRGTPDEALTIEQLTDGEFRVAPYPFDTSPLVVTVPVRTVRKGLFDSEESSVRAYYRVERELTEIAIRPARGIGD